MRLRKAKLEFENKTRFCSVFLTVHLGGGGGGGERKGVRSHPVWGRSILYFLGGKSRDHYSRFQKLVYFTRLLLCFLPGNAFGHAPGTTYTSAWSKSHA